MKVLAYILGASALALLGFRLHDIGWRFGDLVAYWVLIVTVGVEAGILFTGFAVWRDDPIVQKIAQQRALLEMAKGDKRAGRRVQERAL